MIKEDYVSFYVAKKLQEKGADFYTTDFYNRIGRSLTLLDDRDYKVLLYVKRPTLWQAMKWLREVHDIHVVPRKDFFNRTYTGMIYDGRRENVFDKDDYIALLGYETYEEACEAAIKYSLENLV